ncbi:hypothetical protein HYC85_023562 [Camellia sinensis]|uniref:AP2/ERF domain-containing protein n=1 Tax=Camellia sinensis TaxID=4442 RepID=A0A7J7GEX4_CAMSI|nr:hypothetical protein HYC85_023562 [Camellia sinensis]
MRPLKHHLRSMEAHRPVVVKSVKCHKRESCAFVIGEQSQPQPQLGQVFLSTTTTGLKRSSRFRGVSRAYNVEGTAGRAYDLAAIKYWGPTTFTNFQVSDYETEMEIMQNVTKEEYLASLRRRSSGFSRGVPKYRGVARHHHNGRWEARIGRVPKRRLHLPMTLQRLNTEG